MNREEIVNKFHRALNRGFKVVRLPSSTFDNTDSRQNKQKNRIIQLILSILIVIILHNAWNFINNQSRQSTFTASQRTNESSYSFPLSSCGDYSAGGTNTWYPVYLDYNQSNLNKIRQSFCCDAFYNATLGGIQVASFYSGSRANEFAKVMRNNGFSTTKVGRGKTIKTVASNRLDNNCK